MDLKNKHGLSRNIPAEVKRKVRENSHFGCVICGKAVCQYDHVDPEFNDAIAHDPNCITLLCPDHHSDKSCKRLHVDTVKEKMKNPFCKEHGLTKGNFFFGDGIPQIQFGNILFTNPKSVITIDGFDVLSISPPSGNNPLFLLNAIFQNDCGEQLFSIEDNAWFGSTLNWDIEVTGREINIRSRMGIILLHIENIPREKFIIHRVNLFYNKYQIESDKNGIFVFDPKGEKILELKNSDGGEIKGGIILNIEKGVPTIAGTLIKNTNIHMKSGTFSGNTVIEGGIIIE